MTSIRSGASTQAKERRNAARRPSVASSRGTSGPESTRSASRLTGQRTALHRPCHLHTLQLGGMVMREREVLPSKGPQHHGHH